MNISFKKDINKSYMVIEKIPDFSQNHFSMKMLSSNSIEGLLPISFENLNGCVNLLYDISSKQAFSKIFETKKISFRQIKALIFSLKGVLRSLEEYLLDANNIILKQECIFADPDGEEFSYCYDPYYNGDLILESRELFTRMLSMVDYQDERAVRLIYEIQSEIKNENFTINDILVAYRRVTSEESQKVQKVISEELDEAVPITMTAWDLDIPGSREISQAFWTDPKDDAFSSDASFRPPVPARGHRRPSEKADNTATGFSSPAFSVEEEPAGFFEKFRMYLKGRKVLDVLDDINSGEFREKVRACGKVPEVQPAFTPEDLPPRIQKRSAELLLDDVSGEEPDRSRVYGKRYEGVQKAAAPRTRENRYKGVPGEDLMRTRGYPLEDFMADDLVPIRGKRFEDLLAENSQYVSGEEGGTVLLSRSGAANHTLVGRGLQEGLRFMIQDLPFTIGKNRDTSNACLNEPTISRMHARIYAEDGAYYIEDLNSTNGTFLNEQRLPAYTREMLHPGDRLRFAAEEFSFQ